MSTVPVVDPAIALAAANATIAPVQTQAPVHEGFFQKVENVFHKDQATVQADAKKVLSVLELAGQTAEKGLLFAVRYAPKAEVLFDLIYPNPAADAAVTAGVATVDYIQKGVIAMEAAYAASPAASATGEQKAADLLALSQSVVLPLLKQYLPNATAADLQGLINKVVAILKVVDTPVSA